MLSRLELRAGMPTLDPLAPRISWVRTPDGSEKVAALISRGSIEAARVVHKRRQSSPISIIRRHNSYQPTEQLG